VNRRFGGTYKHHLQGRKLIEQETSVQVVCTINNILPILICLYSVGLYGQMGGKFPFFIRPIENNRLRQSWCAFRSPLMTAGQRSLDERLTSLLINYLENANADGKRDLQIKCVSSLQLLLQAILVLINISLITIEMPT
jgi:hypothetical protein